MTNPLYFWLILVSISAIQCHSTKQVLPDMTGQEYTYLALGDSYTIGESVVPQERYPVQLANQLRKSGISIQDPTIIATTGWTTLDLARAMGEAAHQQRPYSLVSLLIGVNDQYQNKPFDQYETNFRNLLDMAIELAGGDMDKVMVISIPDYAYTPFGQKQDPEKISQELDAYNAVNREITNQYNITYFDITPISRLGLIRPELVAGDQLHPSGTMYAEWVELMKDEVIDKFK